VSVLQMAAGRFPYESVCNNFIVSFFVQSIILDVAVTPLIYTSAVTAMCFIVCCYYSHL